MSVCLGGKGAGGTTDAHQDLSRRAAPPGASARIGAQQGRLPGKSGLGPPGGGAAKRAPEIPASCFGAGELASPRSEGSSGPSSRQSPMTPRASPGPASPGAQAPTRALHPHKPGAGGRDGLLAAQQLLAKKLGDSAKVNMLSWVSLLVGLVVERSF